MLKGHPKGLFVFLFANMGERFGYYTMMAIFILFMQAKFGLDAKAAGQVYGIFLFGIYFIPLLGGIIADKFLGFGKTITLGIILMIAGYAIIAVPTGIITAEIIKPSKMNNTQICQNCHNNEHDDDAQFCKECGTSLDV